MEKVRSDDVGEEEMNLHTPSPAEPWEISWC
jgi:hypothetical protein